MKQPSKAMMVFMSIPWLDIIQTILAILRITNVITWSWWIILLPLWIFDVLYIFTSIVEFISNKNIQKKLATMPMPEVSQEELTPEMQEMMKQVKEQFEAGNMTPIDLGDNINGNTEDNVGGLSEGSEQSE